MARLAWDSCAKHGGSLASWVCDEDGWRAVKMRAAGASRRLGPNFGCVRANLLKLLNQWLEACRIELIECP